jgi:hypothetical protein
MPAGNLRKSKNPYQTWNGRKRTYQIKRPQFAGQGLFQNACIDPVDMILHIAVLSERHDQS